MHFIYITLKFKKWQIFIFIFSLQFFFFKNYRKIKCSAVSVHWWKKQGNRTKCGQVICKSRISLKNFETYFNTVFSLRIEIEIVNEQNFSLILSTRLYTSNRWSAVELHYLIFTVINYVTSNFFSQGSRRSAKYLGKPVYIARGRRMVLPQFNITYNVRANILFTTLHGSKVETL